MSTKTINICIPVFNEEENLQSFFADLKTTCSLLEKKYSIKLEIIFFDDGSTDNSRNIINKFENMELLYSNENKGLGYAIKELINFTKNSDAIGMFKVDSDGQMNMQDLEKYLEDDFYKDCDVIYGNRFHKHSNYRMPKFRRIGSIFFKYFLKIFSINISDPTNGFVYLSKKYIENFKIIGNYNAAQQILLDAKLRNLKIAEVGVDLNTRERGRSFIGIKYPIIVISNLVALYVYKKTVRVLIAPGIVSLILGFVILLYNIFLWIAEARPQIISDQILILLIVFGAQLSITGFIIEIFKNKSD
jgi:glycosyltransferase involved in cell wall biosynthesis